MQPLFSNLYIKTYFKEKNKKKIIIYKCWNFVKIFMCPKSYVRIQVMFILVN